MKMRSCSSRRVSHDASKFQHKSLDADPALSHDSILLLDHFTCNLFASWSNAQSRTEDRCRYLRIVCWSSKSMPGVACLSRAESFRIRSGSSLSVVDAWSGTILAFQFRKQLEVPMLWGEHATDCHPTQVYMKVWRHTAGFWLYQEVSNDIGTSNSQVNAVRVTKMSDEI